MNTYEKGMPWWLVIITGVLMIGAGIFLLVSPAIGLNVLTFLVGLGVLLYGIYNIYKAIRFKDNNRVFTAYLVHGLLDLILFLLILTIDNTPVLLGTILAVWLMVFGVFGIVETRRSEVDNKGKTRVSTLLVLIGLVLLVIPLLLSINYVILLGIIVLVFGIVRLTQGFIKKAKLDDHLSEKRSKIN